MIFMVFEANKNAFTQKWFTGIEPSNVVCTLILLVIKCQVTFRYEENNF